MIGRIKRVLRRGRQPETPAEAKPEFIYVIDYPTSEYLNDRTVQIEGWVISTDKRPVKTLRLKVGSEYVMLKKLIERQDVANAHDEIPREVALNSGFKFRIDYLGDDVSLEADFGDGFKTFHKFEFELDLDVSSANFNPELATNWADHIDLIDAKDTYFHEDARAEIVSLKSNSPKTIAFYLPQFHPIPENDYAWGKGFTEWTNVSAATPRIVGHRQPLYPADFGFYDLRVDNVIKEQIELAKQHGIYGFCFYYYWFSGNKALEKPLQSFLRHKEWDFNFMICWANENWTKRWDGRDEEIILEQKFARDDPLKFIKDIEPILLDKRYIRVDNKPALIIYRPEKLDETYVKTWREYFKKNHNLELHLVTVWGARIDEPSKFDFDAAIEFTPGALGRRPKFAEKYVISKDVVNEKLIDIHQSCNYVNYRKIIKLLRHEVTTDKPRNFPLYRCITPSWDNDARRSGQGSTVYLNENPDIYYRWLKDALDQQNDQVRFTFLNAWNEWAEGAILEPSTHYGHAVLNRTSDAIRGGTPKFPGMKRSPKASTAAIVRILEPGQLVKFTDQLKNLNRPEIDVYVTISKGDGHYEEVVKKILPKAQIFSVPRRGKELLPFLHIARRAEMIGYKACLRIKIDSQESTAQAVDELLKNDAIIKKSLKLAESKKVYICNKTTALSEFNHVPETMKFIKDITGQKVDESKFTHVMQPLNSCFWASLSAMTEVNDFCFMPEDFLPVIKKNHNVVERIISASVRAVMDINNTANYFAENGQLETADKR